MRISALLATVAAVASGCLEVQSAPPEPAELATRHFVFHDVSRLEADWYEHLVSGAEVYFDGALSVPRIHYVGHGHGDCPAPYCLDDEGEVGVFCSPLDGDCPARVAAVMADTLGPAPALLRDGLIEVLAGGLGDSDVLDGEIDRGSLDVAALLDDGTYTAARASIDPLRWELASARPAADLVRFLMDRDPRGFAVLYGRAHDLAAWRAVGGLDAVTAAWRASPPRRGRRFRLPLAECASPRVPAPPAASEVFVMAPIYARDVDAPPRRAAIGTFVVPQPSSVLVEVQSTVGGRAHFRVEPCANSAAPRFVLTRDQAEGPVAAATADLPAGRYFVVAGSDGPTFSPSELLRVKLY